MTIYEVKRIHEEKFPDSFFFSRGAMKFFHQTLKDFSVTVWGNKAEGRYLVSAPMRDASGRKAGESRRIFNAKTGELETFKEGK